MASLETTRGRQVPAWQQANRYYQEPTDYVAEMQPRSQSATAPATRRRRTTTRKDMAAIRLYQQQNPSVIYNGRSKPNLRRYQRYK